MAGADMDTPGQSHAHMYAYTHFVDANTQTYVDTHTYFYIQKCCHM